MYNPEYVLAIAISKTTQALAPIIPHPGKGKRIALDYLFLNAAGGANVLTLGGKISASVSLASLGNLIMSNDIHNPLGVFPTEDDQPLNLTLGSATSVTGFALYRIING